MCFNFLWELVIFTDYSWRPPLSLLFSFRLDKIWTFGLKLFGISYFIQRNIKQFLFFTTFRLSNQIFSDMKLSILSANANCLDSTFATEIIFLKTVHERANKHLINWKFFRRTPPNLNKYWTVLGKLISVPNYQNRHQKHT